MSTKYTGGFITKSPVAPTTSAASGIWTLDQQQQAQKAGTWPSPPIFIEDLFSTYLYTGTGATQTITNGINLSGNGGLVWTKLRSGPVSPLGHGLEDTTRGATKRLASNTTAAESTFPNSVTSFSSTGYVVGSDDLVNSSYGGGPNTYVSWTFRKQPKFFDIVTYTGNSVAGRTVAHNLGSVPGSIFVKVTSAANDWLVYHRNDGTTAKVGLLNSTQAAFNNSGIWFGDGTSAVPPTSTEFTVSNSTRLNLSGETYVAYLFAHDAGGFPASGSGSTNGISCGSFTADGSGNFTVNLGYEPQWLMFKRTDSTSDWVMIDNMRGWTAGGDEQRLYANTSGVEAATSNYESLTATGFASLGSSYVAGAAFIYIAIRRGPMKTPTVGTSVFTPAIRTGTATTTTITGVGFPPDAVLSNTRDYTTYTGYVGLFWDRLRGAGNYMRAPSTNAEANVADAGVLGQDGYTVSNSGFGQNDINDPFVDYSFRRAPGFFDEVCYTGNGSVQNVTHNLTVVPELMIVKNRTTATYNWFVYLAALGNDSRLLLNTTAASSSGSFVWDYTSPTSSVFTVGASSNVNGSAEAYVNYLFATCAGVSKVGSYTGTGALQTVNCGFTSGARFVLIKRTDSTGDWYVYDSARGITSGNDPYLLLNSTAAEVTGTNYVDTDTTGFKVTAAAPAGLNANGGTYIFLAIA